MLKSSRPRYLRGSFALAAIALSVSHSPVQAQLYNAFNDFSWTSNPNGVWQYGTALNASSAFTLTTQAVSYQSGQLAGWSPSAGDPGYPFILKSSTGSNVTWGTTIYPGYALAMHPEQFGRYSVVEWTAPTSDSYSLQTNFFDIVNDVPATVDVHVRLNGIDLFSGLLDASNLSLSYASTRTFAAGDKIDFMVGSNGPFYYDHTGFNAQLAVVNPSAVPEPSTYGLLGAAALVGMVVVRRRRTRAGRIF